MYVYYTSSFAVYRLYVYVQIGDRTKDKTVCIWSYFNYIVEKC